MAERMQTDCDPHLAEGEQHDGDSYRMSLAVLQDGKWVDLVPPGSIVDLCPTERGVSLKRPVDLWQEFHRPDQTGAPTTSRKRGGQSNGHPCRVSGCGYGPFAHLSSRRKHERDHHGIGPTTPVEQSAADPPPLRDTWPQQCGIKEADGSVCRQVIKNPQGMGRHRSTKHGIPGTSRRGS
ncbi:hypothetical protein ABN028_19965 [Actinopolymorpha sp. B17G11]|uniref:hypothetical protein n=1 Tax=Actinopolymorpha sp. B17G11 TaxID=3160861 RepID=UPI0032E39AC3